jgi:hypothetical protein
MGRIIGTVHGKVEAARGMSEVARIPDVRGAAADGGLIAVRVVGEP